MEPRFNLVDTEIGAKFAKRFGNASLLIIQSTLPKATQDLMMLRVSQINGCGWCTDVHSKDLAQAGETWVRINLVAAWRESTVFTEAERAALALAEEGTRLADAHHGVSDETWAEVRKHYDDDQIAALVALVAQINAANRLGVIVRQQGAPTSPACSTPCSTDRRTSPDPVQDHSNRGGLADGRRTGGATSVRMKCLSGTSSEAVGELARRWIIRAEDHGYQSIDDGVGYPRSGADRHLLRGGRLIGDDIVHRDIGRRCRGCADQDASGDRQQNLPDHIAAFRFWVDYKPQPIQDSRDGLSASGELDDETARILAGKWLAM